MYEYTTEIKVGATGVIVALTAFWGLTGLLWLLWVLCLAIDHLAGTAVACRAGEWSSARARAGIWGKLGSMLVVLVAAALDFITGLAVQSYGLPFTYTMLLCPIVLAWYILTELGSILENAHKLGAPLPPFLARWIAVLERKIGQVGDAMVSKLEKDEE